MAGKGSKVGSNVIQLPNKQLNSLTEVDLHVAFAGIDALMRNRIPVAVCFAESGVVYDGKQNAVEKVLALVWLTCKGEAVITKLRGAHNEDFTPERVQQLVNSVAQSFREDMQRGIPQPVAANDDTQPA